MKAAEPGLSAGSEPRSGATNPLPLPSVCQTEAHGTQELGCGAAATSTKGHSPTLGLEWPPARGAARLQGAWKLDHGCLFSCLSWRRLPHGPSGVKTVGPVPTSGQ